MKLRNLPKFSKLVSCSCDRCMRFCRGHSKKKALKEMSNRQIRNNEQKAIKMSLLENEVEAQSDYFDNECCGDNEFSGLDDLQRQLMEDIIYDNEHYFDNDSLYDTTSDDAFGDYDWDMDY